MRHQRAAAVAVSVVAVVGLAGAATGCGRADVPASATTTAASGPTPDQLEADLDPTCVSGADVAPGATVQVVQSGAAERSYLQYIPTSYEGVSMPVVVDLHDAGATAAQQDDASGLRATADADGFVLLTPQGLGQPPTWDVSAGSADVQFVTDLLDQAATDFCLEPSRVYAVGAGHGGELAGRLACELSSRIAAIAFVADIGAPEPCDQERSVPMLGVFPTWSNVEQSIPSPELASWAARYGCDVSSVPGSGGGTAGASTTSAPPVPSTATSTAASSPTVTVTPAAAAAALDPIAYDGCGGGLAVEYVTVDEGTLEPNAPIWPATHAAEVARTLSAFFAAHPIRR